MSTRVLLLVLLFVAFPLAAQEADTPETRVQAEAPGPDNDSELRQAYRKEFAFLAAQKRDLEQRLTQFEQQARSELSGTESNIERLQETVVALESETESLQARLRELEQQRVTAERNTDILGATFRQADVSFSEHDRNIVDGTGFSELSEEERLRRVFGAGLELLRDLGSIRREPGSYYSMTGDLIEGEILHFGAVASYGIAGDASGILVPAGGGELKLWREPHADVAAALANGEMPQVLPMFIYGSRSTAVETGDQGGVFETIQSGGTIAWLIVVLAMFGVGLVIARIVFLKRASTSTGAIIDDVGDLVRHEKIDEAIEVCRQRKGSTAAVVASALRNLHREREALDDIINESILHESTHLERFGTMILVIAAVSPLLGLLGTVTGMITTFEVITEHGTGDPQLLSGGISIALVTTELGLIVAIPLLLIGNMLSGWADRIKDDMTKAALRVINQYNHVIQHQTRKAA